jgi:LEA14-like dessication related protein
MSKKIVWALLPLFLVACAKPTQFDYLGVKSFKVLNFGLKESSAAVNLEYYNPNKFPVTMKSADVDVYINNSFFGKATLDSTLHIPKKDTFSLPVLLTIDMTGGAMSTIQILNQGQDSVFVKMDGKARVGRGGFFINYPIKYEGMQKIKF